MKRLLAILEAGDRYPSGVVRGIAYSDLLKEHGFSATFVARQPLRMMDRLDNLPHIVNYIPGNYRVKKRLLERAARESEQSILRLARGVDIVYLSKVTSYPLMRALRAQTTARIVYDFGDAIWLSNRSSEEFDEILRMVDVVTTDNELTAEYIRRFNPNCVVIPDTPQVEAFDKRRAELGKKADDRVVLGWLGTPSTAYNLYVVWEALEELFRRHPHLHLRLVGTGHDLQLLPPFERVRFTYRPSYNQSEMVEEVFGMHIGLFPLQNVERCRVRGVLKAAVYMSGQAAVVSSPVGQCPDLIEDGVNGMLAGSNQEWVDKLELLIADGELRARLARNGLETVRSRFRLEHSFAKLKEVFLSS